jgi:hypothetical protein
VDSAQCAASHLPMKQGKSVKRYGVASALGPRGYGDAYGPEADTKS